MSATILRIVLIVTAFLIALGLYASAAALAAERSSPVPPTVIFAESPPPPPAPTELFYDVRKLRRAKALRTTG